MAINIAIDGPSASGKSTIANELCKELGYNHLDTGAMYRCVALKVVNENIDYTDESALEEMLARTTISYSPEGNIMLDGVEVGKAIRTDEISMMASNVSTKMCVRTYLVAMQQEIAANGGYVMDGRDIGTVVLPDAEVKIYLVADPRVRAKRRYLENKEKGIKSKSLRELEKEIIERDYQDTHRKISPLKKADDAIEIDSSHLSIQQVVDEVMKIVNEKI